MKVTSSQQKYETVFLYKLVFGSFFVRVTTAVVGLFFLLQPIVPVFADELESESSQPDPVSEPVVQVESESETKLETVRTEVVDIVDDDAEIVESVNLSDTSETNEASEPEVLVDIEGAPFRSTSSSQIVDSPQGGIIDTSTSTPADAKENIIVSAATTSEAANLPVEVTGSTTSDPLATPVSTTTEVATNTLSENTTTTTSSSSGTENETVVQDQSLDNQPDSNSDSTGSGTSNATSTDNMEESELIIASDTIKSSTTAKQQVASATVITLVSSSTVRNEQNFYQFGRSDCVDVGDGSFYCGKTNTEDIIEDAFFSAPDSDGDMEIFVTIGGETVQITHNLFEDKAPYYDALSDTLVWHRLIDGRYQIMTYDFDTDEEEQLTSGTVNNMEPARYGEKIVWQRWVLDNWEIILLEDGSEEQITDSVFHDVSPTVRGDYVLWNANTGNAGQVLMTYNLSTKERTTIDDADGVAAHNPRMVLLYDKTFENGDVVTRGFDIATGKVISLGVVPAELPDELPESDQTGETRALIQQKPSFSRDEFSENDDDVTTPPQPHKASTTLKSTTTTSSDIADIVIPSAAQASSSPATATSTDTGLEDILVTDVTATSTEHIPDIIIPPVATSTSQ